MNPIYRDVAASEIRTDGGTQIRSGHSPEVVAEYASDMARGDQFPPIVVFFNGTDYWLADGFHRLAAFGGNGVKDIPCEIHEGSVRDATLYAIGANAQHGMQRSRADKRQAVLRLLNDPEWSQWSDREIARRANVSHPTVSTLRASVTGKVSSENEGQRTYTTKHGTTATMRTQNIGTRKLEPITKSAPAGNEPDAPVVVPLRKDEAPANERRWLSNFVALEALGDEIAAFDITTCSDLRIEDVEDAGRILETATARLVQATSIWRNKYGQTKERLKSAH